MRRALMLVVLLASCNRRSSSPQEASPVRAEMSTSATAQLAVQDAGSDAPIAARDAAAVALTIPAAPSPPPTPPKVDLAVTLDPFPALDEQTYPDWSKFVHFRVAGLPLVADDGRSVAHAFDAEGDGLRGHPKLRFVVAAVDTGKELDHVDLLLPDEIADVREGRATLASLRAKVATRRASAIALLAKGGWSPMARCRAIAFPTDYEAQREALGRNDPQTCATADLAVRYRSARLTLHAGKGGRVLFDASVPWDRASDTPVDPKDPSAGFFCNYGTVLDEIHYDSTRRVALFAARTKPLGAGDYCADDRNLRLVRLAP